MDAPSLSSRRVAVVGAGISGLACAYRLQHRGFQVILFEASDRTGGLVGTVELGGFLFESGPQSFQGTEILSSLFQELGIENELLKADPHAPRFVFRHRRLHRIPMSPQDILTSSLLGARSRWKIASEPFRRTRPPTEEESIADFVRRKFGHEILEYLVAPFVSGVYAGDPEKLSLRAAFPTLEEWEREYGSILRGAMKSRPAKSERKEPPPLCTFRRGLRTLTEGLAHHLGEKMLNGAAVVSIQRTAENQTQTFEIKYSRAGQDSSIRTDALIFATPAYTAAHAVECLSSPLAATLSGIAYAPVAVVAAGYKTAQFKKTPEGFGFLIPRSERLRTLGTVFNSVLFPGRAPADSIVLTSFVGGATDPEMVRKTEEEIAAIVAEENSKILDIQGPPTTQAVWRHPKALPQYNLGHSHIVKDIREAERELPGLFFAGNYLEGPALGKCVEHAFNTADAAQRFLQASS